MRWCIAALIVVVLAPDSESAPKSGYEFQSDDVRSLQDDDFQNPGMLWVDEGETLFRQSAGESAKSCASCHAALDDAVLSFPKRHAVTGKLVNLTTQIQRCRTEHQRASPLAYESREALALTAWLGSLARGRTTRATTATPAPDVARGKTYFETRRGQLNLACRHCHELSVGLHLRGDLISEGHGNGYPAYRLEWEGLGSLHRRLRACDIGVRTEPHPLGSEPYIALELFLRERAAPLPVETPAVRR